MSGLKNEWLKAFNAGRFGESIDMLREYLNGDPNDLNARKHLAVALAQVGNHLEAETEFLKLIATEPNNPAHFYNLGKVCEASGDDSKARECYQKALSIRPDYKNAAEHLAKLVGRNRETTEPMRQEPGCRLPLARRRRLVVVFTLLGYILSITACAYAYSRICRLYQPPMAFIGKQGDRAKDITQYLTQKEKQHYRYIAAQTQAFAQAHAALNMRAWCPDKARVEALYVRFRGSEEYYAVVHIQGNLLACLIIRDSNGWSWDPGLDKFPLGLYRVWVAPAGNRELYDGC